MQGIGAAAGPLLAGVAMDALGPTGLLYTLAGFQAVIALFAVTRVASRRGVSAAQKGDFSVISLDPVDGDLDAYPDSAAGRPAAS
jgi:hypothetical protein